jgi:hypothetical protein
LHPLDFLGVEDDPDLRFFPGMNLPREQKSSLLNELLTRLTDLYRVAPMREQASAVRHRFGLADPVRQHKPPIIMEESLVSAAASV